LLNVLIFSCFAYADDLAIILPPIHPSISYSVQTSDWLCVSNHFNASNTQTLCQVLERSMENIWNHCP